MKKLNFLTSAQSSIFSESIVKLGGGREYLHFALSGKPLQALLFCDKTRTKVYFLKRFLKKSNFQISSVGTD